MDGDVAGEPGNLEGLGVLRVPVQAGGVLVYTLLNMRGIGNYSITSCGTGCVLRTAGRSAKLF